MTGPVPPADVLDALVTAVLARLRAAAPALGVPAQRILDAPVDPLPEGTLPAIAVYPVTEDESFGAHGHPASDDTAAELLVVARVGDQPDWRAQALALRHRVRLALLTDPAFVAAWPPRFCRARFLFDAGGAVVLGQAALTFGFGYATAWPPDLADAFLRARVGVDAIDPYDPTGAYDDTRPAPRTAGPDGRREAEAEFTPPQEEP